MVGHIIPAYFPETIPSLHDNDVCAETKTQESAIHILCDAFGYEIAAFIMNHTNLDPEHSLMTLAVDTAHTLTCNCDFSEERIGIGVAKRTGLVKAHVPILHKNQQLDIALELVNGAWIPHRITDSTGDSFALNNIKENWLRHIWTQTQGL